MLFQDEKRYLERKRQIEELTLQITIEANRLLQENLVDVRGSNLYFVYPCIYEVEKKNGVWLCSCEVFLQFGICQHSTAVTLKEWGYG